MCNIKLYLIIVLLPFLSIGCKEQGLQTYSGPDYVHFTPSASGANQVVDINFAETQTTREMELKVPVELSVWGFMPEKLTKYMVSCNNEKSTGVANKDYVEFSYGEYRPGLPKDTLWITVKRGVELLKTDFCIRVCLEEMDGYNIGPLAYSYADINVTDKVNKPKWWNQAIASKLGEYYDIKFRLFCYFEGKYITSLEEYSGVSFGNKIKDFKKWWKDQWEEGNFVYYSTDGVTPLYETISD